MFFALLYTCHYNKIIFSIFIISYDTSFESEMTTCIKVDKSLVVS